MLRYVYYLTQKLRKLIIYLSRSSYNEIHFFSIVFEVQMSLILINIVLVCGKNINRQFYWVNIIDNYIVCVWVNKKTWLTFSLRAIECYWKKLFIKTEYKLLFIVWKCVDPYYYWTRKSTLVVNVLVH